MPKVLSSRKVKKNRLYSTAMAAEAIEGRRQTIQLWIFRHGLKTVDGHRPHLIRGSDLISFMAERRKATQHQCRAGEFFCFRCRDTRSPAFLEPS